MQKFLNNQQGFVALISVIILSASLLILVALISIAGYYTRFNVLDLEDKQVSVALAEGCTETALVRIAQNSSYAPAGSGDCVSIGGTCGAADPQKVCKICSVSAGPSYDIVTRAVYNKAYSTVKVKATLLGTSFTINSWDEQTTGPAGCTVP